MSGTFSGVNFDYDCKRNRVDGDYASTLASITSDLLLLNADLFFMSPQQSLHMTSLVVFWYLDELLVQLLHIILLQ
jgi:hypothetical protein